MNSEVKTTCAGKWSVALVLIPVGGVLLFLLPVVLSEHSGEAGLGALLAIGVILHTGTHIVAATSLLGVALGIFAIYKTRYKRGMPGLILNFSTLVLSGAYLMSFYHSAAIDPDRLPIAAYQGDYKTVEKLIAKGFDINRQCGDDTALSNAATGGREQIVEILLSHGADVNIGNPLGKAAQFGNGNEKIVKLLLEHGANTNCLHSAVLGRHKEIVQLLLEHGAAVNQRDGNGRTPLHLAVVSGTEEIVKLLVSKGADVNARDNEGEAPLHILVQSWPQDWWTNDFLQNVTGMLLDAGADIEAKTRNGKTPLYVAAEAPHARRTEAVKLLLKHGANLENIQDIHIKFTAAPISMGKSQLENWVRSNAPNVNVKNSNGQSLLHAAVKGDNKNLVEILLAMGANVNEQDNAGDTPLHWALQDPNIDVVQLLINNRADVNIQNKQGQTPLHTLVRHRTIADEKLPYQSQIKACELLLANGANVEIADKRGWTPLTQQKNWLPQGKNGCEYRDEVLRLMEKYTKE